jgi:LysM repeat protein
VSRRTAARYAAPLAFLAAITAAVLLVRAGLNEGSVTPSTTTPVSTTTTATEPKHPAARYYRIRAGDTLAAIAPRFDLTEAELLALNPGIEPTGLHVGQRIRVR